MNWGAALQALRSCSSVAEACSKLNTEQVNQQIVACKCSTSTVGSAPKARDDKSAWGYGGSMEITKGPKPLRCM